MIVPLCALYFHNPNFIVKLTISWFDKWPLLSASSFLQPWIFSSPFPSLSTPYFAACLFFQQNPFTAARPLPFPQTVQDVLSMPHQNKHPTSVTRKTPTGTEPVSKNAKKFLSQSGTLWLVQKMDWPEPESEPKFYSSYKIHAQRFRWILIFFETGSVSVEFFRATEVRSKSFEVGK